MITPLSFFNLVLREQPQANRRGVFVFRRCVMAQKVNKSRIYSRLILADKDREIYVQRTAISNAEAGKSVSLKAKLIA
jgi:hypothetical protein